MYKIALDIDGVLCWFTKNFVERAHALGVTSFPACCHDVKDWGFGVSKEDFGTVWNSLDEEFWLTLPVMPQSRPPIPFTPQMYLTARPFDMDGRITSKWLYPNKFPPSELCVVANHGDKIKVMQDRNMDILIDDYIPTIQQVNAIGKRGILFAAPYHRAHDITGLETCQSLWDLPDDWRN